MDRGHRLGDHAAHQQVTPDQSMRAPGVLRGCSEPQASAAFHPFLDLRKLGRGLTENRPTSDASESDGLELRLRYSERGFAT